MSESILRWEDPPSPSRSRADRWTPVADELRANPQKWACIAEVEDTGSLVQYVKKGQGPFGPAGSFDAVSRSLPRVVGEPTKTAIYARFVGADGGEES